ncbi:hypothetical protein [Bosea vestrisii]|uniref:Uncharacterized protein n=1 Tax=Bosea vestrisii TaxID=151416 RepID=A0ABW0HAW4_9HYPH
MQFVNAHWTDSTEGFVRAEIDGETVVFPADPQNRHYAALIAGSISVEAYVPLPPQPPEEVLRHQALLALYLSEGITEQMILTAIDEIPDTTNRELTRIRFMQARWQRNSEFVTWGAARFDLAPAQVDQLFLAAPTM